MGRIFKTYFLHIDCDVPRPTATYPDKDKSYIQDIQDMVGRRASIDDHEPTEDRPFVRLSFEFKKRESLSHAVCQLIEAMPELARRQQAHGEGREWLAIHIIGPVVGDDG